MSQNKKKGFVGTPHNPYAKTELCKNWPNCPFGDSCSFAHGESDLRCKTLRDMEVRGKIPSAQKYRCYLCMNFVSTGACPYKHRCVFLHDPRVASDSSAVIYARPGEATFRTGSMNKDAIQWPANKQVFNENLFFDIMGSEIVEYTAPDQYAFVSDQLLRTIFFLWSGFVDAVQSQTKKETTDEDLVSQMNLDPRTEFFFKKTYDFQVVKVPRLAVFQNLANKTHDIYDEANVNFVQPL